MRRKSATCRQGHEMTPENTYVYGASNRRECRICRRDRNRRKAAEERKVKAAPAPRAKSAKPARRGGGPGTEIVTARYSEEEEHYRGSMVARLLVRHGQGEQAGPLGVEAFMEEAREWAVQEHSRQRELEQAS